MGVIPYDVPINAQRMTIGVQGENNVRQFLFDVTEWRQITGDIGAAEMVVQRNGDSSPYATVITMQDENTVSWIPTETDTAKVGAGKIQLMWIASGHTVKTKIFDMKVDPALDYKVPDDSIDPWASWMPNLLNADARIKSLEDEVGDVIERQTSPYIFCGSCNSDTLPENPVVNDTCYLTDLKYRVTWTGEEWQQSSMSESDYTDELNGLSNALDIISGWTLLTYSKGYIACDVDVIDLTDTHPTAGYGFTVDDCTEGDVYVVNGTAASSAKGWCFVDSENRRITWQGTATVSRKKTVIAPTGAVKFISNYKVSSSTGDLVPFVAKQCSPSLIRPVLEAANTLSYKYGSAIPENSNANNYISPGNYYIASTAIAATISNIPVKLSGRLTVMLLNADAAVHQIFISSMGDWYVREFVSNEWRAWKKLSETVKTDAISTAWGNAESIAENENINDYLTPGNYYIAFTAIAATISNLPVKLSGRLVVMTINNSDAVHQIFISSMGDWYVRELVRGEWRGWKRFVDEETVTSLAQNASAAHGAYNAIQALIKNADYDIAFANAYLPLSMHNYLGNTQNVHPKVLYFANGFGGHNYWMAYTPYPYSNDAVENPCVAWSNDGLNWTNIAANPLAESPGGGAYNSDTHLVYRSDTATIECWYRRVDGLDQDPRNETILRRTSTDGINWTEEEVLYVNDSGSYAKILSPAIIWDGSKYCIWAVYGGTRIDYYTAPGNNPGNWTKIRSFEPVISDDGLTVTPWHIDVIKDNGTYVMLMMCRNGSYTENNKWNLFIMTSSDNVTYSAPYKVLNGADNWDRWMYRSSIVKVGNKYRIYYSAGTGGSPRVYNNSVWGLGISESDSLTDFVGLYE